MPENVVDTPKTPEADLTALKTEIKRLEFDVVKPIEEPNFHSFDGADLRQDETRRTQYFRELLLTASVLLILSLVVPSCH